MKRKVLTGGYAYDKPRPRKRFNDARLQAEGLKMLADREKEERETIIRRIERAVEADWLSNLDISQEVGCSENYVSEIRRRFHLRKRTRMTG